LGFLREFKHVNGYHLIIVPKAVIPNWKNEFAKWLPQAKVLNLIATKEEREELLKNNLQPGKFDVCLTTFEGVRLCMTQLQKFKWEYLIVDEAHKIKNEESQISQRLRQLHSRYRLLLTGTPLQNNLHELWSLLNFLLPEIFKSSSDFDEWFNLSGTKDDGTELTEAEKEQHNKNIIE
jgi:SWI/SNF-related matrix-associated actin-dependent regulator of chromatin subfamily A member 5